MRGWAGRKDGLHAVDPGSDFDLFLVVELLLGFHGEVGVLERAATAGTGHGRAVVVEEVRETGVAAERVLKREYIQFVSAGGVEEFERGVEVLGFSAVGAFLLREHCVADREL